MPIKASWKLALRNEHRAKIGSATKDMWKRGVFDKPETRAAYSKAHKGLPGKKWTEERKRLKSESMMGKGFPKKAFTRESIELRRQQLIGKPKTEESNKKRSVT